MQRPFLTIGIASYNYAGYLQRAFDQIRTQQFTDYEILYCDDGSTDGSQDIIRGFMAEYKDMQIRLVTGDHEGLIANRNRILDNARGEYLLICDTDDYMLDGCLEALCTAAREQNADCVLGGYCEVDGNGNELKSHIFTEAGSKWLDTWHHAQIYRTEIYRQHKIRFTVAPDDVCFLWPLHLYCKTVAFVPQVLYAWVRHADSTSRQITIDSEWSPVTIWHNITETLATFREQHAAELTDSDRIALDYYLYKWYYLNVADLSLLQAADRTQAGCMLAQDMRKASPQYRKLTTLLGALHAGDTTFARLMVAGCWTAERLGLLSLVYTARARQSDVRARRMT